MHRSCFNCMVCNIPVQLRKLLSLSIKLAPSNFVKISSIHMPGDRANNFQYNCRQLPMPVVGGESESTIKASLSGNQGLATRNHQAISNPMTSKNPGSKIELRGAVPCHK
mmetsp:Transcript_14335/g.18733  ORF Transcript_14335/g.18733 Transcript_14335/m.18733 type:complete len:110 (+) Transcript_14335:62-391(+)